MEATPNVLKKKLQGEQHRKGVPFFVFDMKFGISGAQPLETFTKTLEDARRSLGAASDRE